MGITKHFNTEDYAWNIDVVQNLCESRQFFLYNILGPKCFDTLKIICYSIVPSISRVCLPYFEILNASLQILLGFSVPPEYFTSVKLILFSRSSLHCSYEKHTLGHVMPQWWHPPLLQVVMIKVHDLLRLFYLKRFCQH